jgi:enoyl-CoA hydratase/carnithine racemase
MTFDTLSIDCEAGVGTITVDRPKSHNALTVPTLNEIGDAVEAMMADADVAVVVIAGAGDSFISGADIGMFNDQSGLWFKREFRRAFTRVEEAIEGGPKAVVAAVDGGAFGGGLELTITCDMVVASERSTMGFPEATMGTMPGAGGTQRLAHLVGYLRAKELVLTGRRISAEEAADLGIVTEVVPDDAFDDRLADLTGTLTDRAPYATWFAKEVIDRTRVGLDDGLSLEAALGALLFETEDVHEGFAAFLDSREPEFNDWSKL